MCPAAHCAHTPYGCELRENIGGGVDNLNLNAISRVTSAESASYANHLKVATQNYVNIISDSISEISLLKLSTLNPTAKQFVPRRYRRNTHITPNTKLNPLVQPFIFNARKETQLKTNLNPSAKTLTPILNSSVSDAEEEDNNFQQSITSSHNIVDNQNPGIITPCGESNLYSNDESAYSNLKRLRAKHFNRIIIAHLNINSIRYKFEMLCDLVKGNIDLLLVSENKLIRHSLPHNS